MQSPLCRWEKRGSVTSSGPSGRWRHSWNPKALGQPNGQDSHSELPSHRDKTAARGTGASQPLQLGVRQALLGEPGGRCESRMVEDWEGP